LDNSIAVERLARSCGSLLKNLEVRIVTKEEQKKRRKKRHDRRCRHFNGIMNEMCDAGIGYPPADRIPCRGDEAGSICCKYSPYTTEELDEQDAAYARKWELMKRGLSDCCEAPIDESRVTKAGSFKGHGPRFCSKCRRLLFMV
jgi:hypothetical protein